MNGIEMIAVLIKMLKRNLVLCITNFWGLIVMYVEATTVFHI
jgi:hypothetical protein